MYWVIKRDEKYYNGGPSYSLREWGDGLEALRWRRRRDAESTLRILPGARIVRVTTRPRSERLYLAERLAAWEPVVRAVSRVIERWPEGNVEAVWAAVDVWAAVGAIPEEHRP